MEKQTITTHFIKSPDFKTSYVSGIFGGPNAQGQINLMHFIERVPLPTSIEYAVGSDGVSEEIGREAKLGVVREVQGGLIIDIDQAKSIVTWLEEKISQVEMQITKK